jgi:hypothetical protein
MVCVSGWSLENQLLIRLCRERFKTMALKNLNGFVKMAIADNKNLDKETVDTLCQYVDDLKVLIDNQDSLIKSLRNALEEASRDMKTMGDVIWKDVHV